MTGVPTLLPPCLDLRMPLLGAAAWLGAVVGTLARGRALVSAVVVCGRGGGRGGGRWRRRGEVVVAAAGAAARGRYRRRRRRAAGRADRAQPRGRSRRRRRGRHRGRHGRLRPARRLRRRRAFAGDQVVWRLSVHQVTGRGRTLDLAAPVLVLGEPTTRGCRSAPPCGCTVGCCQPTTATSPGCSGRAARPRSSSRPARGGARPARFGRHCATRWRTGRPTSGPWCRRWSTATTRRSIPSLQDAFRATGLTHLLAVSGTNLTLVVGFLLALARWCRVRGRWLHVVAAAGIVGFVLIARTEPSVLRAAVMGTIGLIALGTDGRHRALRGLGTAVVVLVLLDPALAVSAGFALSVLATGGILLLAPAWRDALARWLPRWLAEAIAVPAAAQLACTPLVAAISGQVSLVAVVANLLVAPVIGPATVLGLAGGVLTLVWAPVGRLCGTLASWCVAWLITVAEHGAALPTAAVGWGTGAIALVLLTLVTVLVAALGPWLLRRPVDRARGRAGAGGRRAGAAAELRLASRRVGAGRVRRRSGRRAGAQRRRGAGGRGRHRARARGGGPVPGPAGDRRRAAAGADPLPRRPRRRDRGVFAAAASVPSRPPGCSTRPAGCARSTRQRRAAGLTAAPATYAAASAVGPVTLQVLWPPADSPTPGPGDGSTANEASVVLLVEVAGVRLLLTGDVSPRARPSWRGCCRGCTSTC